MATIQFANPGTGPLASAIGWIDYGTLVVAPGTTIPGISASFPDGSSITFDLSNIAISGGGATFNSSTSPAWGGASFGNTGYNGISGKVVLYSTQVLVPATSELVLSNIVVKDPNGNPITNYSIVGADAESTDILEQLVFKTNAPIWNLLTNLPTLSPPPLGPNINGLESNTVTISGAGQAGSTTGPVLISRSPNQVSASISVFPGQLEGAAFGIILTKVTVVKDITNRIFPNDQFSIDITGNPSSTNTTIGSTTGPQTLTEAVIYDIPQGNSYSFTESMASGSFSLLNQYSQLISAINVVSISEGGTDVSGINALEQVITPTIGDNIIVNINNTPYPVSTKKMVDKQFAGVNDIITYTIAVVNASINTAVNVNFIDTIPNGTTFIPGSLEVDGVTLPGSPDPPTGITITTLVSGQLSTISFKVESNSIPSPNLVQNSSTINYTYSIPTIPGGSFNSNIVTTTINYANLSSIKSVNKSLASVGDVLTYTIELVNTGTTNAINVLFVDTIPNDTTFNSDSLTVNSSTQLGASPAPPGYAIASIPIGTTTVTFQVTVDTIPSPNPILNSSSSTYDYIIDPSLGNTSSSSTNSNIVNTTIYYANISNPLKIVDKTYASIGDILTYSMILRNIGNTTANNVVFIDTIPNGTVFLTNSVLINGATITGASPAPPTGVSVGSLGPAEVATVIFSVTVIAIPSPNPILNSGTATYQYVADPLSGNVYNGSGVTNAVSTTVINANLDPIVKTVDKVFATVGDTLTYAVSMRNLGNTSANNVMFIDTIPVDTTFITDSLSVNGITITGADPSPPTGTNIGTIPADGTFTVTFKVIVSTLPSPNTIVNSATTKYDYLVNPQLGTSNYRSANSNTVSTAVEKAIVNTIKLTNATNVIVGDTITYTIVFENTGNTTANNIVFKDTIPTGTSFIPNSVQINGFTQTGSTVTPPNGLSIPNLGVNQVTTLTFNVTAITIPSPNPTTNTGTTTFNYIVDPTLGTTGNGASNTNLVSTFINNNTNLMKSVDKQYATVSDTLTYTLSLQNTLSITQNNLTFIDTIPTGTSFIPNSIKINAVPQIGGTITPPNGLSLGTLGIGQSVTVTFDVTVDTIPSPNTVLNTGISIFNYVVDPILGTTFTNNNISNTVATTINFANITNLNKQVDENYALKGDILTYTISFTNIGNTTALNLIFKDTIPTGTTYVQDSFTINGTTIVGANPSPPNGVNIGTIPVGVATTLAFKVTVTTIPSLNLIINTGSVYYDYIVNDQTGGMVSSGGNTNNVYTTTNYADITKPIKIVDRSYADIGTTITYTIRLTNTGNETANNVIFIDTVPNGTTFINDSVQINGTTQIGVSPAPPTGISIGDIGSTQTSTITFGVIVNTVPSPNPIVNLGTVSYQFIIDPTLGVTIRASGVTNNVDTLVNRADLLNIKSVNKDFAKIGDIVTYTIGISNTGNTTAYNIVFKDTIPNGMTFVDDSFIVNGTTEIGANPSTPTGVNIGTIPAGNTSTVSFAVIVNTIPTPNPALNSSTTEFNYIVDPILGITAYSNKKSNIVNTQINSAIISGNKSVDIIDAIVGDSLTYSINLTNIGNIDTDTIRLIDTIPNGTFFVPNSVSINGITIPNVTVEPPIGTTLPNLIPGQSVNIKFKVTVTTIPTPNPLINTASTIYDYIVDPILGTKGSSIFNTNTVPTFVSLDIKPIKTVSSDYATIGDLLTYTIVWKNVLNTDQFNLVFIDTIPNDTTFVKGSITVNGIPKIGASIAPPIGLYLGTLPKGRTVTVTYNVTVDTVPSNSIIDNDMTAIFNYVSNNQTGTIAIKSSVSNTVDTRVNLAKLENVEKSVDKDIATMGDVLTYTITFENTGNIDAVNVIFKDKIPDGTSFVPNSFTVNGVVQYGENPGSTTGANIGIVPAGAITTLTFKVNVDETLCVKDIYNTGSVDYDYLVNPNTGRYVSQKVNTNTVRTKIIAAVICAQKETCSSGGFVGMQIIYKICIRNIGNTEAYNVNFIDMIPNGTSFVPNSVTINDIPALEATVAPPTGLVIDVLGINELVDITFRISVDTIPCPNPICNFGTINYSYNVEQNTNSMIYKSKYTNTIETYIDPCSYFIKLYETASAQSQILDEEYEVIVCQAKKQEEEAKELERLAKNIRSQAKIALEKGCKLNVEANELFELAGFYSKQSLESRANMHSSRHKQKNYPQKYNKVNKYDK